VEGAITIMQEEFTTMFITLPRLAPVRDQCAGRAAQEEYPPPSAP